MFKIVWPIAPETIVSVGVPFHYLIRLTNETGEDVSGITLVDPLPAGLIYRNASDGGSYSSGDRKITWTNQSLAKDEVRTYSVEVLSPSIDAYTNTAVVTVAGRGCDDLLHGGTCEGSAYADVRPVPTNPILKGVTSSLTPAPGDWVTYVLRVPNRTGIATSWPQTVVDDLPSALQNPSIVSPPANSTASFTGTKLTWNLPAGITTNQDITFKAQIKPNTPAGGLWNEATISGNCNKDCTAGALVTVTGSPADVKVSKTGPASAAAGSEVTWTITARNDGGSATKASTVITDQIPSQIDPATVSLEPDPTSATATFSSGTVTWTIPAGMATGASDYSLTVKGRLKTNASGTMTNTAAITDPGAECSTGCSSSATTTITPSTGKLSLTTSSNPSAGVHPGTKVTYSYVVTNSGTGDLKEVRLTQGGALFAANTIVCPGSGTDTIPTLTQGQSVTCTLEHTFTAAEVKAGGPSWGSTGLSTTANAAGKDANDVPIAAPSASATTKFAVTVTPTLTKNASFTPPLQAGSTITYTLDVGYSGDGNLVNVTLDDPMFPDLASHCVPELPASMAPGFTSTCTVAKTLTEQDIKNNTAAGSIDNTARISGTSDIWSSVTGSDTASATATLDTSPLVDFSGSKSVSPTSADPGDTVQYTVSATNNGQLTATNVVVRDAFKGAAAAPIDPSTCDWPTAQGTLKPTETVTCRYSYVVTAADASSDIKNTASVTGSDGSQNYGPTTLGSATVSVSQGTDLSLAKTNNAGTNRVGPLQTFDYQLTARNDGPAKASGVILIDKLPDYLTFEPATQTGWSYDPATRTVTSAPFDVAGGGTEVPKSFTVQVAADAPSERELTNYAAIQGMATLTECAATPTKTGCAKSGPLTVDDAAITISKTNNVPGSPKLVKAGEKFRYTVTATNGGGSIADGVVITDRLPAGLAFASATQEGWASLSGDTAVSEPMSVPGNTAVSIELDVVVTAAAVPGSTLLNVIALQGANTITACVATPSTTGCGRDMAPPSVLDHSKVTVTKKNSLTVNKPKIRPGTTFTYTITVTNNDTKATRDVVVSDTLPAGLWFPDAQSSAWTINDRTASTTIPVLEPGPAGAQSFDLTVTVADNAQAGWLRNIAVLDDQMESGCNLASPSHACGVDPNPPYVNTVVLTKSAGLEPGARVKRGADLTYTFTADNTKGTKPVEDYRIIDSVPVGAQLGTNPASEWDTVSGLGGPGTIVQSTTPFTVPAGGKVTKTLKMTVLPGAVADSVIENRGAIEGGMTPIAQCVANPKLPDCVEDDSKPVVDDSLVSLTKTNNVTAPTGYPRVVRVNDTFLYTIVASNAGASEARDVVITEQLPAGLEFDGPQDSAWNEPTGRTMTSTKLAIPGHDTKRLLVRVKVSPDATGVLKNVSAVNGRATIAQCEAAGATPGCGVDANPPTVDNTAIATTKTPSVGKDEALKPGESFTYSIAVKNTGSEPASGVRILDKLPAGLELDPGVDQDATWQYDSATRTVSSVSAYTLAKEGGSQSLVLAVRVVPGTAASTVIHNVGTINTTLRPGTAPTACAADERAAGCFAEPGSHAVDDSAITITKQHTLTGTPPRVMPGDQITYKIVVTNSGKTEAKNVRVTDALPAGLTFAETQDSVWKDPTGASITSEPLTVPGEGSRTLTIRASVGKTASGRLTNVAAVDGMATPAECRSGAKTTGCALDLNAPQVADHSQVSITKKNSFSVSNARIARGTTFTYTIKALNNDSQPARDVIVSDTLPAGLAFADQQDDVWTIQGNKATTTIAQLQPGAAAAQFFELKVRVTDTAQAGLLRNIAVLDEQDPTKCDMANPSHACGVDPNPPYVNTVVLTKSAGLPAGASIKRGAELTYTFTADNRQGTKDVTSFGIIDSIPAGTKLGVNSASEWKTDTGGGEAGTVVSSTTPFTVPAGQKVTKTLVVQVLDTAASGFVIDNRGAVLGGLSSIAQCLADASLPGCVRDVSQPVVDDSAISITKRNTLSGTPPHVMAGESFSYQIVATNSGASQAKGVVVSDQLPVGLSFAPNQDSAWRDPVGRTITSLPFTVDGTSSRTLTIAVTVDPTVQAGTTLTNVAAVSGLVTLGECDSGAKTTGCAKDLNAPMVVDHAKVALTKSNDLPAPEVGTQPRAVIGQSFTYTLAAKNGDTVKARGVRITDKLPAGLVLDGDQDTRWELRDGGRTLTYLTDLDPNQEVRLPIRVMVAPSAAGTLQNIGVIDAQDPAACAVPSTTNHCGSDPRPPYVDTVQVTKSSDVADDARVKPGQLITYTWHATNPGGKAVANVAFVDQVPAAMVLDPASQTGWTAPPGAVGAGTQVRSVPVTMAPGATLTRTLTLRVDPNARNGVVIRNVGTVGNGRTPVGTCVSNPTRPDCVAEPTSHAVDDSVITLRKTNDVTQSHKMVQVNETFTYTIVATNTGASLAQQVVIDDVLPEGLEFAGKQDGHVWADATDKRTIASKPLSIPGGESLELQLTVKVAPGASGTLTNAAAVHGKVTPALCVATSTLPGCGVDNEPVTVDNTAVSATKTPSVGTDAPLKPGQALTYTFDATNAGAEAASGVRITDKLPVGLELDPAHDQRATWLYDDATRTLTSVPFALGENGGIKSLELYVRVLDDAEPGSQIRNLGVIAKTSDDGPSLADCVKNPALEQCIAEAGSHTVDDSAITVETTNGLDGHPPYVTSGDTFTYTMTVANSGKSADDHVVVRVQLPDGLTFEPGTQNGWKFSGSLATSDEFRLAGEADKQLRLAVKVADGLTTNTVLSSVAAAAGSTSGGTRVSECVTDETKPGCGADKNPPVVVDHSAVTVEKVNSLGADPVVVVGQSYSYDVTVTNTGTLPVTKVIVSDTLPAGLAFDGPQADWTITGATASASVNLAAKASTTLHLTVRVAPQATGTLANVAVRDHTELTRCGLLPGACGRDPKPPRVDNTNVTLTKASGLEKFARVKVDKEFDYTITALNSGTETAAGVRISDTLPAGLAFASESQAGWTITGRTATATLNLEPDTPKPLTLRVKVSGAIPPGAAIVNEACTVNQRVNRCAQDPWPPSFDDSEIQLTKTNDTGPWGRAVQIGDTFTYTIRATNSGHVTADNVVIDEELPAGLEFASATQTGWASLTGRTGASIPLTIAGGEHVDLDLTVKVTGGVGTRLINAAAVDNVITPAECRTNGALPGCGVDALPPEVVDHSAVEVTKTNDVPVTTLPDGATARIVGPGDTFGYTLTVTNTGAAPVRGVKVSDVLPAGLVLDGGHDGWTMSGSTISRTIATLAPKANEKFEVRVKVADGFSGTLQNVAVIDDADPGACRTNPTGQGCGVDPAPPRSANVRLSKTNSLAGAATVSPGQPFTYTIAATNGATGTASDIVVVDELPAGLVFASTDQPGWTIEGSKATSTRFSLDAGETRNLTLNVVVEPDVPQGASLRNVSAIYGIADPATCRETPTATGCGVDAAAPLADRGVMRIEMKSDRSANPGFVNKGQPVGYDITVTNTGYLDADAVTVHKRLPEGLVWDGLTQSGWESLKDADGVAAPFALPAGGSVTLHVAAKATSSSSSLMRGIAALTGWQMAGLTISATGVSGGMAPGGLTGIGHTIEQCVADPTLDGCAFDDLPGTGTRLGVSFTKENDVEGGIIKLGRTFTYKIAVHNTTSLPSKDIVVRDTLPAGLGFASAAPAGWTIEGATITSDPFDLAGEESRQFEFQVRVLDDASGSLRNAAVMDEREAGDCLINASLPGCAVDTRPPLVDLGTTKLSLTKKGASTDVNKNGGLDEGDTVLYSFTVTNTGDKASEAGLAIEDPMLEEAGIPIVCPGEPIGAGESVTCQAARPYVLSAQDQQAGKLSNYAIAAIGETFSRPGSFSLDTCVDCGAALPTTGPAPRALPFTGAAIWTSVIAALALAGAGVLVLLASRRRRGQGAE